MEERIHSFAPIADAKARLLILGSMPSVESLRQSFYYSHPRNAFWTIMASVLGENLPDASEERAQMLRRHGIALWDVAHSCIRQGSLDSAIREVQPNDFEGLFARCPKIEKILFNGATARSLYEKKVGALPQDCICEQMPSTSPAYTISAQKKLAAWRGGMEGYYD